MGRLTLVKKSEYESSNDGPPSVAEPESLVVDIDGFEGPIDMLLALARTQKVDLMRISVLELVEQYVAFIEKARSLRVELAADYLVMAAWLVFLKSRLLLPKDGDGQISEREAAKQIALRLKRLEAMRESAKKLFQRDRLGRQFFARGQPEIVSIVRTDQYSANIYSLIKAYAGMKSRNAFRPYHLNQETVMSVKQAMENLRGLIGDTVEWSDLARFLPEEWLTDGNKTRMAFATAFAASLELAKSGIIELRQEEAFAPLELRKKNTGDERK